MTNQDQLLADIDAAFAVAPPLEIYTHIDHCEECARSHYLLKDNSPLSIVSIDDIDLLWNALCLSSPQATLHFMPGLVRLSLRNDYLISNLSRFLGCLDPELISALSKPQKKSLLRWLYHLSEWKIDSDFSPEEFKTINRRIKRTERVLLEE